MITCDETIDDEESVSTNVRCSVVINAVIIVSTNFGDKNVGYKMDCCILYKVLLMIILIFIIAIICCHYTNDRSKEKRIGAIII